MSKASLSDLPHDVLCIVVAYVARDARHRASWYALRTTAKAFLNISLFAPAASAAQAAVTVQAWKTLVEADTARVRSERDAIARTWSRGAGMFFLPFVNNETGACQGKKSHA